MFPGRVGNTRYSAAMMLSRIVVFPDPFLPAMAIRPSGIVVKSNSIRWSNTVGPHSESLFSFMEWPLLLDDVLRDCRCGCTDTL